MDTPLSAIGDEPHAVVIYSDATGLDITPYRSYGEALDSLRHRATCWERDDDPDFDVWTAEVDDLSAFYADGDDEAWVEIIALERPVIRSVTRDRLLLEWP